MDIEDHPKDIVDKSFKNEKEVLSLFDSLESKHGIGSG